MKRKSIRIMISLLLVLSLSFGVLAVNPNAMTDISGHWARDDIRYCLEQGLFTGTSATTFEPNKDMSRGMFVTVLGRVAGVGQNEYGTWCIPYLYSDVSVDKYYAPYIAWATRCGIVNGIIKRVDDRFECVGGFYNGLIVDLVAFGLDLLHRSLHSSLEIRSQQRHHD